MLLFGPMKETLNAFTGCFPIVMAGLGVFISFWLTWDKGIGLTIPALVWLACQPFIGGDDDPPSSPDRS